MQTVESAHDVPFVTLLVVHPVAGLQPSVVQGFESLHVGGVPGVHVPPWQVSAPLQAFPSEHGVPLLAGACWQPLTASQLSTVHGSLSLQFNELPAVHVPP